MIEKVRSVFIEKFAEQPAVFRSPGRINVIGEHTDYNEGFVLPAAIDRYAIVAAGRRTDNKIFLYAKEFDEHFDVELSQIKPIDHNWTNYILGVVDQLVKRGDKIGGFN